MRPPLQILLSYPGPFWILTHRRSSTPSLGSFCLSRKHMTLLLLPAPCWSFKETSWEERRKLQSVMAQSANPKSRSWLEPSPDCESEAHGLCRPDLGGSQA